MSYQISSITFMDDGVVMQYLDPATDVRVEGQAVQQHQLTLSAKHPDYRADIEGLHGRAVRVLLNALDDFDNSEPHRPEEITDEQEAEGMGGGHE